MAEDGAALIEGNTTWDPLSTLANLRQVAENNEQRVTESCMHPRGLRLLDVGGDIMIPIVAFWSSRWAHQGAAICYGQCTPKACLNSSLEGLNGNFLVSR